MKKPRSKSMRAYIKGRERHIKRMGEIVWHANQLQSGLFKVFWSILGTEKQGLALAIWHSFKSDAAQREMLEAVAASELPAKSRELKALKWICRQATYLSGAAQRFRAYRFDDVGHRKGHTARCRFLVGAEGSPSALQGRTASQTFARRGTRPFPPWHLCGHLRREDAPCPTAAIAA
jgi:hypothetical protein